MRFALGKHFTIFRVWMPSHDHFSSGTGFSLWGFVLASTKVHRLKPAPHGLHAHATTFPNVLAFDINTSKKQDWIRFRSGGGHEIRHRTWVFFGMVDRSGSRTDF